MQHNRANLPPPFMTICSRFLLSVLFVAATARASGVFGHDPKHGNVIMGIKSDLCDNGETNLDKDWDGRSVSKFSCSPSRRRAFNLASCHSNCPKPEFHLSEPEGTLVHHCMDETISYQQLLPTSGPHRPLWPIWGRYTYLPAQRWLHSLEHGGIVALYHPCVAAPDFEAFAEAVSGCLRRHIIAADAERLTPERPFALLAYRNKILLTQFDLNTVQNFIMRHALKGPEDLPNEGQYSLGLISKAMIVTDEDDSQLCPNRNPIEQEQN